MRRWPSLCQFLIVFPVSIVFVSCASSPRITDGTTRVAVDVGTFSVMLPGSADWNTKVNKDERSVETIHVKRWWTGKIIGSTIIKVFENRIIEQGRMNRPEQQAADEYLSSEEKIMATASQEGSYKLESATKGKAEIGGKTLYTLAYKIKQGRLFIDPGSPQIIEAVLYLYFPANFAYENRFYGFLISEAREQGAFVSTDLNQIVPVIESFSIKP